MPTEPPRKGEDAEATLVPRLRGGGVRCPPRVDRTPATDLCHLQRLGRPAGHHAGHLQQSAEGTGEVRRVRQSLLGQMVTSTPCSRCSGTGEEIPSPCPDCRGEGRRREERSFVVDVPAGVDEGSTLRLPGRGAGGLRGGPAGDLYVHLRVRPHPTLTRRGPDLLAVVHVAMTQAALGITLPFETLEGTEELEVPRWHPQRPGDTAAGAGRAPPPGPGPRRSRRHDRRGHPRRSEQGAGRAVAPAGGATGRGRGGPRDRPDVEAARGVQVGGSRSGRSASRPAGLATAHVVVADLDAPLLDDADAHHLQKVLAFEAGRRSP